MGSKKCIFMAGIDPLSLLTYLGIVVDQGPDRAEVKDDVGPKHLP